MRLAFAGTPEFARVALQGLVDAGFDIALVLTQPDRPAGRGMKLLASPVKRLALEHGIAVVQPRGLRLDGRFGADARAAREALVAAACDVLVVAAYGLILPHWLLDLPRHGCLNIHASLLPRWRGAAPIQRAIEAGDAATGITIMQMDAGLDTGDMLQAGALPIAADDSSATLLPRLAALGSRLIVEAIEALAARGERDRQATPQPALGVTYAAKIAKAEALIDWREPAAAIERRLRAFDPFPGARGVLDGEKITCWRGELRPHSGGTPGEIVAIEAAAITVACGDASADVDGGATSAGQGERLGTALALTELQRAGGRRLPAAEFLRGFKLPAGARFAAIDTIDNAGI